MGKSARVYAPYVLLRSLQQWRGRETITLPSDIRTILEATYAEPAADEPETWQELRAELERQKAQLAANALSATNIWTQPALPDEEGVQTRFSTYRTAHLLLVRSIEVMDAHAVRLHPLEGEPVEASDRYWNFNVAKTIYRNLTRVPHWAISAAMRNPPGWLTNHVSQPTAVGLVHSGSDIGWLGSEAETGLSYHADQGIIISHKRVPRMAQEEFDESYD